MESDLKTQGTIAAGHHQTALAGKLAYEAGGNAIDAAISALLASCVTEPCMSGFGGGGFALVKTQGQQPKVLDFFCQTPIHKKSPSELEFEAVELKFAEATEVFHVGKGSMAVPGLVRGVFELHDKLGTLPIQVLAEPAIKLAREGAEVDWFQAYDFELLEVIFQRGADAQDIFYKDGKRLGQGDTTKNRLFVDLLQALLTEGSTFFYDGEVAVRVVDDCRDGGHLIREDFANYTAVWREALTHEYEGGWIHTNPGPSRGGTVIVETLKALQSGGKPVPEYGSEDYSRWMLQGLKTGALRAADQYSKWGSTTHLSTADGEGNAVSVSVSNGEGSGYFIPATGIQMNNMLGEAALFPNGFHSWEANERVQSLMSPTIVENCSGDLTALGTGGAGRIPVVLSQVIAHLIFADTDLGEAIERGRMYFHEGHLEMEPGLMELRNMASAAKSKRWARQDMFFGGVHAASLIRGKLLSKGDSRRNGRTADVWL